MKAALHIRRLEHQIRYGAAMKHGLERHGIEVTFGTPHSPEPCDFAVVWGWKQPTVQAAARHVLVMEAPHIRQGNPLNLTACSLAWDGLARRGRVPWVPDAGRRWNARWGELMQPWRFQGTYALILGQVPGDASLYGFDIDRWAQKQCEALRAFDMPVVYRPHPLGDGRRTLYDARGSRGTLAADLEDAASCVTYSSTGAVEAVLAGVPTVVMDPGAVAWPVASHGLSEPLRRPDRTGWAHQLAWTQWTLEEIEQGDFWPLYEPIMESH